MRAPDPKAAWLFLLLTLIAVQAAFIVSVGALAQFGFTSNEIVLAASLLGALVAGLIGVQALRAIDGPMRHLVGEMLNISEGKLDNRICVARDDEIGEALRNLQTLQTLVRFRAC